MRIENGTYCVYVHINKANGKMYVGQTVHGERPHKRWDNGNGYIRCPYFEKAIRKYGWDNFEHEVVANNLTAEEADNFERLLIEKFNTMDPDYGYNIEPGGTKNKTISEATRKKMSESKVGEKNPMYGVHLTGEKNGMFGKHRDRELVRKLSEHNRKLFTGRKVSEETKRKMSQSKLGKYAGENSPMYGRHHTAEAKKKMSEGHKGEKACNAKKVVQMDDDYNVIKIWGCMSDAYRTLGICRQSIPEVLNGNQKHAGGYRWLYLYDQVR